MDRLIEAIDRLKTELGIPKTVQEAGVDEKAFHENLDELSEMAFDDQCTGANPRYPLIAEIRDLFLHAYHRKEAVCQ